MPSRDIVFATDFSPCAERAYDVAVPLARALDARLHVVHALFDPVPNVLVTTTYVPPSQEELGDLAREAQLQLEVLALQAEQRGVAVVTAVDRGAAPAETIVEHAERSHADLLVIGTHGRSVASRLLVGSVALEVIRSAGCPVLAIRSGRVPRRAGAPKRILVAFDFSPLARRALEWAVGLARELGAAVELLYVAEEVGILADGHDGYRDLAGWREDEVHRLQHRLEDVARLVGRGVEITVDVRAGRPATVIRERVAAGDVDWVALGTHGYSGLQRLFYGSTAEEVVRSAEVPVLLINPGALAEGSRVAETAAAAAPVG